MKAMNKTNIPLLNILMKNLIFLPSPNNINYMWNFGSMMGMIFILQLMTGILISMHFNSNLLYAFDSVAHIMKDINLGWMIRTLHMNGASLFFIFIYFHIFRGLNYSSFNNLTSWVSGVVLLLMLMATAFLGYVLPWGQMSFWGATVITNLLSAIPYLGNILVNWLWGGFAVDKPTLTRFFSLHFLLPFLLIAGIGLHLIFLHDRGSSNPSSFHPQLDKMEFSPFFYLSDTMGFFLIFFFLFVVNTVSPNILGDPENFNPANPLSTPLHIQPEWYFLFAYAILRSIPNKLGGVLALLMSILILMILPIKSPKTLNSKFKLKKSLSVSLMAINFFILTWIGANVVEPPFDLIGKISSITYFLNFLLI